MVEHLLHSRLYEWICRVAAVLGAIVAANAIVAATPGWSAAAEYVLHISVDGLRPSFLQEAIDLGDAPNFERFLLEGATTMNARTDFTHTITLPNHTKMLTGRPVSQPVEMPNTVHHGYTSNGEPQSTWTLHNFRNLDLYIASTFDVAHDAGLSTAHYASNSKFFEGRGCLAVSIQPGPSASLWACHPASGKHSGV